MLERTQLPQVVLLQVQLIAKFCPSRVQDIVRPYISSYFAHPELLLLTMLASHDPEERSCAVDICRRIRNGAERGSCLPRRFVPPALNFNAQSLAGLIDWDSEPLTEPLMTASLRTDEVEDCRITPLSVPATWQCHSQGIERAVKKVSEACQVVVGQEKRRAWIRCADHSRRTVGKMDSKADFVSLLEM